MSKEYNWLTGWYATRLHAVPADTFIYHKTRSLCGHWVYKDPPNNFAKKRFESGEIEHCVNCEKKIERSK